MTMLTPSRVPPEAPSCIADTAPGCGTLDLDQGCSATEGTCSVKKRIPEKSSIRIEETRDAIRASIERAHELVCEAREMMRLQRRPKRAGAGGVGRPLV